MALAQVSLLEQSSALCKSKTKFPIFRSSKVLCAEIPLSCGGRLSFCLISCRFHALQVCCRAQRCDDIMTTASVPVNRRNILAVPAAVSFASLLAGTCITTPDTSSYVANFFINTFKCLHRGIMLRCRKPTCMRQHCPGPGKGLREARPCVRGGRSGHDGRQRHPLRAQGEQYSNAKAALWVAQKATDRAVVAVSGGKRVLAPMKRAETSIWPGRNWQGRQWIARRGLRHGGCSQEWQNGCARSASLLYVQSSCPLHPLLFQFQLDTTYTLAACWAPPILHVCCTCKGQCCLVQVGIAAPVLTALIRGTQKESVVSEMYGGDGGERAATDEVYSAIGNVWPFLPCLVGAMRHSSLEMLCSRLLLRSRCPSLSSTSLQQTVLLFSLWQQQCIVTDSCSKCNCLCWQGREWVLNRHCRCSGPKWGRVEKFPVAKHADCAVDKLL